MSKSMLPSCDVFLPKMFLLGGFSTGDTNTVTEKEKGKNRSYLCFSSGMLTLFALLV